MTGRGMSSLDPDDENIGDTDDAHKNPPNLHSGCWEDRMLTVQHEEIVGESVTTADYNKAQSRKRSLDQNYDTSNFMYSNV